jgi:hypothetical protein
VSSDPKGVDEERPGQGVSPRAAKQLRDAMDRLLAGRPQRTDGRLIKDNLWKEADLSRATMNRAVQVLAEWNCRVAECDGFTPREARKNDEVATLRKKLEDKTRECTELHHRLDAAATAIAALHHDNVLLRQELNGRGQLVALQVHR